MRQRRSAVESRRGFLDPSEEWMFTIFDLQFVSSADQFAASDIGNELIFVVDLMRSFFHKFAVGFDSALTSSIIFSCFFSRFSHFFSTLSVLYPR